MNARSAPAAIGGRWEVAAVSAPSSLLPHRHAAAEALTRQELRRRVRRRMMQRRRRLAVLVLGIATVTLVVVDLVRGAEAPAGSASLAGVNAPVNGGELDLPPVLTAPKIPQATQSPSILVPQRGKGTFALAGGASRTVGRGALMRYKVETENGGGVPAAAFAAQVEATLADPRGWTGGGQWAFQRVSTGRVDFVVRLATPRTVDKVCTAAGLNTGGYVSCRTGPFVMINLARWELAVPDYKGDVARYRHYVINHEVGHRLGRGHELCPGRGKVAPIMQQQTYGLAGCVPNGWPYVGGRLITGPRTSKD